MGCVEEGKVWLVLCFKTTQAPTNMVDRKKWRSERRARKSSEEGFIPEQ